MSAESSILMTRNFSKMFLRARRALEFLHAQDPERTSPSILCAVANRLGPLSKHSLEPIRCCLLRPGADMRRREFIGFLGATAVGSPLGARAQQGERVRRIGVLLPAAADDPE